MDTDRRLPFEKASGIGHTVFRRDTQAQMDMIRHRMPLNQLDAVLLTQIAEYLPDIAPQLPLQHPPLVLGNEHSVIRAIPSHMSLTLPLSHGDLLSCERGGSLKGGHYTISVHDGTAEPLRVSPPEAVAYLM